VGLQCRQEREREGESGSSTHDVDLQLSDGGEHGSSLDDLPNQRHHNEQRTHPEPHSNRTAERQSVSHRERGEEKREREREEA
jgi:hypothetical protein